MGKNNPIKRKVIVDSELVSSVARAKRLRQVRNMANLSRKEMCSGSVINLSTYKGWEIGRGGGISIGGAKRVIARVKKDCQIADDGLIPHYHPKDFVAGLKHQDINLTELLNKNCIIALKNEQILTRCLKRGNEPNTFLLYCTNPETTEPNITVSLEDIVEIAVISRYYKINFPNKL